MDVTEVIKERKSIRAFKPDSIPRELLRTILDQACHAPSWANTQPWEFAVVTGKPLQDIQRAYLDRGEQEPRSEVARPYEFPEPYLSRIQALAPKGFTPTKESMDQRRINNYKNYGASTVIYLLIDRSMFFQSKGINVWSAYDTGSAVQNIMLLAANYGLGTVAQAQAVIYPDLIRKSVAIPAAKLIALGIAIGYPDWDNPATQSRSQREPLDKVVTWYGFE